jgi:alkylation response protein AidB-like acyl-CoA dehydrogenase
MDFDFSPEQREIQRQAQRVLSERCSLRAVRRVLDGGAAFDRELWQQVAALGWLGVAIPERYGGLGMGGGTLCVIAEELGRALAPLPVSSSIYLAGEAILQVAGEAQRRELLPPLVSGERIATLAATEGLVGIGELHGQLARVVGGRLSGSKLPVPDGMLAHWAVVTARTATIDGDVTGLFLVDLEGLGVARSPLASLDPTRPQARIDFASAPVQALGELEDASAALCRVLDRAAIWIAFEQVGGADAALAMSAEYARIRHAFGRPIGSFQAIKHKLANIYTRNQLARSNAVFGAWALDSGATELPLAAAAARVAASEAYEFAAKETIQTHGGFGVTWEADPHLFYRRARSLQALLDGPARWRNRLVDQLEARIAA